MSINVVPVKIRLTATNALLELFTLIEQFFFGVQVFDESNLFI